MSTRSALIAVALLAVALVAERGARLGALGPLDASRARHVSAARPFDTVVWRSGRLDARGAMLASLMRTRSLVGVQHEEVEALLGPTECYVDYEDEPCYALSLDGVRYRLAFSVSHSGRLGRVLRADLDPDPDGYARPRPPRA